MGAMMGEILLFIFNIVSISMEQLDDGYGIHVEVPAPVFLDGEEEDVTDILYTGSKQPNASC